MTIVYTKKKIYIYIYIFILFFTPHNKILAQNTIHLLKENLGAGTVYKAHGQQLNL